MCLWHLAWTTDLFVLKNVPFWRTHAQAHTENCKDILVKDGRTLRRSMPASHQSRSRNSTSPSISSSQNSHRCCTCRLSSWHMCESLFCTGHIPFSLGSYITHEGAIYVNNLCTLCLYLRKGWQIPGTPGFWTKFSMVEAKFLSGEKSKCQVAMHLICL